MQNLRKIWDHQLDNLGSFGNLKRLDVMSCGELTNVFPLNLVVGFERLDCLYLGNCDSIEEIIEEESSLSNCTMEGAPSRFHVFSQLTKLKLWELPKLKSIYEGKHALEWAALKHFEVSGCREVKILFGSSKLWSCEKKSAQPLFLVDRHKVLLPGCNELKLSQFSRLKEMWHDQALPVSSFSYLRILEVDDCTFMTSAIPTNLLPFLNNLTKLKVRNCDSVDEVFHLEELNANEPLGKLFPQLSWLHLIDLPKLKTFCNFNGNIIELPNLSSLRIENCPDIVTFIANSTPVQPLFNEKVILS
ncbi:Disease resistance protein [Melia azedarach]|uniref:Disease resistance protein n=1 Tax=Melia azedarach TaxID=155640 RepID=A0ACC1Y0S8_MELAZ|nr:Disease resistance protein [Melia azedarach]